MLGLFAFFYGCLHFSTWFGLDLGLDVSDIAKAIAKRPFITVGFFGFVLMIPLALTSTAASIRRLGGKRWRMLHRLIYISAIAGVIHYYWLVKSDNRKPLEYALPRRNPARVASRLLADRPFSPRPARRRASGRTTPDRPSPCPRHRAFLDFSICLEQVEWIHQAASPHQTKWIEATSGDVALEAHRGWNVLGCRIHRPRKLSVGSRRSSSPAASRRSIHAPWVRS